MENPNVFVGIIRHVSDRYLYIKIESKCALKVVLTVNDLVDEIVRPYLPTTFSLKDHYQIGQELRFTMVNKKLELVDTPWQAFQKTHPKGTYVEVEVVSSCKEQKIRILKINDFLGFKEYATYLTTPGMKYLYEVKAYSKSEHNFTIGKIIYLPRVQLTKIEENVATFVDLSGYEFKANRKDCKLERCQPLEKYLKVGKMYNVKCWEKKRNVIPIFEHPHDVYMKQLFELFKASSGYVPVKAKVLSRHDHPKHPIAYLKLELAEGVIGYELVTGTMRGDFWQGTQCVVDVDVSDYKGKNLCVYIPDFQPWE